MNIAILGSTGSIGTQTLEVCRSHNDQLNPVFLTAHSNWRLLAQQVHEFKPQVAVLADETHINHLKQAIEGVDCELRTGHASISEIIRELHPDIVLNALVGFSGFLPTHTALELNIDVALANKESLVVGGELITNINTEAQLIPVDSEHSAIYQCLMGEDIEHVETLILTASGGPFRTLPKEEMQNITVEQALNHPNWSMGNKITIDSSTMMNKGLEVIEAKWLFDIPLENIETVIHPQSIIHSMVTFVDGSTKAQLGVPDMMVPIQFALSDPKRWTSDFPRMDWTQQQQLDFEPVDLDKFRCLKLARESIMEGGYAPAILNAANEVAVDRFLNGEVSYIQIPQIVEGCLQKVSSNEPLSIESLLSIDRQTRTVAQEI